MFTLILLDIRPIRLHLLVEQAAAKGNQGQSLNAQKAAKEAKGLASELLQLDEGTFSKRVVEQMRKDDARAQSLIAQSVQEA